MYGCGAYLEYRRNNSVNDPQLYVISQWVWGYMSAYNLLTTPAIEQLPDELTIHAYLEKHCREHPLDKVVSGTVAMIRELGGDPTWRKR